MNLAIYVDGELQTPPVLTITEHVEHAVERVQAAVGQFTGNIALQARMALFDAKHGTNYRTIRNELVEQKRRQEFEKRIGLVACDRKG